ncbi:hypothetical protein [Asticcacaulis sp. YBE204]|uniref:hypothetical protein n=1 Tax=Asticcacaulis sp. YBE204 TaxID=1282363 RepID=UPI0003C4051D|nr:hypothetical protein [Asticcacaulis sp. YBE204]ESQ76917.1 hypothetical protein AEYBE204_18750 [Asticcacaulis sp. YBE204]
MTADEITDAMLDLQLANFRDEALGKYLDQGTPIDVVGAALPAFDRMIAEARARLRPKILSQVMLQQCLDRMDK